MEASGKLHYLKLDEHRLESLPENLGLAPGIFSLGRKDKEVLHSQFRPWSHEDAPVTAVFNTEPGRIRDQQWKRKALNGTPGRFKAVPGLWKWINGNVTLPRTSEHYRGSGISEL